MRATLGESAKTARRRAFTGAFVAMLVAAAFASSAWAPIAGATPPTSPPAHGKIHLNATAGEMEGAFVQFKTPAADDILQDFVSDGTVFFDAVSAGGYEKKDELIAGAELQVHGSNVDTQVHDNPNALIKFTVDSGTTLAFDLGAGLSAARAGNHSAFNLSASGSNRTATVWWHCNNTNGTLGGGTHSFEVAAGSTCRVFFRSHVEGPASEDAISDAAEAGFLMAEIRVGGEGDGGDVASYSETSVVVAHTLEGVSVSLGPEGSRPSSVVIRFTPDGDKDPLVFVDGRAVRTADGLHDALDPTDDGEDIEYSLSPNDDGTTVLVVSVPDQASHVVQIKAASITVQGTRDLTPAVAGVVAALAITAGAALILFRRR